MKACWRITAVILLVIGAIFMVTGILALTLAPRAIQDKVTEMTFLGLNSNGTPNEMTEQWSKPPYKMQLLIWLFHVDNPKDVQEGRSKAHLVQKGPYAFREVQSKSFEFIDNETRVYYKNGHQYFFDPKSSCPTCDLTDNLRLPNVVFQKAVEATIQRPWLRFIIEPVLNSFKESMFIEVRAGQALFDGYDDPLIKAICDKPLLHFICEKISQRRIGFFLGQNNSNDGEYLVDTGKLDAQMIGHVYSWNNQTSISSSIWWSPEARMIKGTDAQLFHPGIQRSENLEVFTAPICRSATMAYKKDVTIEGVPAYRFGPPDSMLDPTLPENRGFCDPNETRFFNNKTQPEGCLPPGMLNIGQCQPGALKLYMSLAHFLSAPAAVAEAVDGLPAPTRANDETYFDVEPTTGVVINAVRRMQINLGMIKGDLSMLSNFTNVIMPLFMINETARFDQATRDRLYNQLVFPQRIIFLMGILVVAVGILLWIGFLVICLLYQRSSLDPSDSGLEQLVIEDDSNELDGDSVRVRP